MQLYDTKVECPLLLGTAQYPSPAVLADAIEASGTEIVTMALRREFGASRAGPDFFNAVSGFARDPAEYGGLPLRQGSRNDDVYHRGGHGF